MNEYLSPNVYVKSATNKSVTSGTTPSVAGFIGSALRGVLGVAQLVTSWGDFILKYSRGLETPFFTPGGDLPMAVYGFFQNGGRACYIVRVVGATAAKAVASTANTWSAKDEGAWGNDLEVITTVTGSVIDVTVNLDDVAVESFTGLTAADFKIQINGRSNYVSYGSAEIPETTATVALSGGVDANNLSDAEKIEGLNAFDNIGDVSLLAIPGMADAVHSKTLVDYCVARGDLFPILDVEFGASTVEILSFRESVEATSGALYAPYIKVVDPLSSIGALTTVPPSGHIAGVYARLMEKYGSHRAPAGTIATIVGAVDLERNIPNSEIEQLNPAGVNSIVTKPGYGIVLWGARSVSTVINHRYVSDILLNMQLKKELKQGAEWAVFEPISDNLFADLTARLEGIMSQYFRAGAFKGTSASEAYFVKCDSSNNTEEDFDNARVNIQVGYARKNPAEFVVIEFIIDSAQ